MVYRCYQLEILTSNQYQYMMRQISKNGWRQKEPDDTAFYIGENIFQGAIDLLKDEKILSVKQLMRLFSEYGVTLYPEEIEDLLHLRKNTLEVEQGKVRIIQLKPPHE